MDSTKGTYINNQWYEYIDHHSNQLGVNIDGKWYPLHIARSVLARLRVRDLSMDSYEPYKSDYTSAVNKMRTPQNSDLDYIKRHLLSRSLKCDTNIPFSSLTVWHTEHASDTQQLIGNVESMRVVIQIFEYRQNHTNAVMCLLASQMIQIYVINFILAKSYSPCFLACLGVGACNKQLINLSVKFSYNETGIRQLARKHAALSEFIDDSNTFDTVGYSITPFLKEGTLLDFLSKPSNHSHIMTIILLMVHTFEVCSEVGIRHNDITLSNILIDTQPRKICIQTNYKRFYIETNAIPILIDYDKSAINHKMLQILNKSNPCTLDSNYFCKVQRRCANYDKNKRDLLIFLVRMYALLSSFAINNKQYLSNERHLLNQFIFKDNTEWSSYLSKYMNHNSLNSMLVLDNDPSAITKGLMIDLDDYMLDKHVNDPHTIMTSKSMHYYLKNSSEFKLHPTDAQDYTLYTMDDRNIKSDHIDYMNEYFTKD